MDAVLDLRNRDFLDLKAARLRAAFFYPRRTMIRATCFLSGRVQGVGMRYAVNEIAKRFAITGYVENTDDGRVRIVVEGDAHAIAEFLAALSASAPGHIRHLERYDCEANGEFPSFNVKR